MTDPDCGLFVKGEHERKFACEAHTACDKNGFVLETVVTPGNVHDSVAFDEVYDKVTEAYPEVEVIVADSAFCQKVFGDNRVLSTAYKRPQTMNGGNTLRLRNLSGIAVLVLLSGWIPGIQKRSQDMRQLPYKASMYPLQGVRENGAAAYLEGLRGFGRRCPVHTGVSRVVSAEKRKNSACVCRCKRETRYALYAVPWSDPSNKLGEA